MGGLTAVSTKTGRNSLKLDYICFYRLKHNGEQKRSHVILDKNARIVKKLQKIYGGPGWWMGPLGVGAADPGPALQVVQARA